VCPESFAERHIVLCKAMLSFKQNSSRSCLYLFSPQNNGSQWKKNTALKSRKVRLWPMTQSYQASENPDGHNESAIFIQVIFLNSQRKLCFISLIASALSCETLHRLCRGSEVKVSLQLQEVCLGALLPQLSTALYGGCF